MKKEMPIGLVVAVIVLLVAMVAGLFLWQGRAPATPEEAGAGLPAKAGGGVVDPGGDAAGSRPGGP